MSWRPIVLTIVAALSLAACSPGTLSSPADPGKKCSDLWVKNFTSDTEVKGTWACMSPTLQELFKSNDIHNDQELATPATLHHSHFVAHDLHGTKGDSYVYRLWEEDSSGNVTMVVYMIVVTDQNGKVIAMTTTQ